MYRLAETLGQPADELLRRMSSRELTEWMVYFAWKDKAQAITREQGDQVSVEMVGQLAWLALDVADPEE